MAKWEETDEDDEEEEEGLGALELGCNREECGWGLEGLEGLGPCELMVTW